MEVDDTTNPVSVGYTPAQGSISGFDNIVDDTITTILSKGWSKEQLHQAILNLRETVGASGVQALLKLLTDHILNKNNPHNVTISQILTDVLGELVSPIFPGTPPLTPPIFTLLPNLVVPIAFLPIVYSGGDSGDGSLGFMTPNYVGAYSEPNANLVPVGLYGTVPVIPMTQAIDKSAITQVSGLLAGSIVADVLDRPGFSGIVADGSGPTTVGFTEQITSVSGTILTATYLLSPADGVKSVSVSRNATRVILVDIATLVATSLTPSTDIGDIERLPNGTIRITHVFVSTGNDALVIAASQAEDGSNSIVFSENMPVFYRMPTQITNIVGSTPPIFAEGNTLNKTTLVGTYLNVATKGITFLLSLTTFPKMKDAVTPIMVFGGITISTTSDGYRIETNTGTKYFLETTAASPFMKIAFSLSASRMCFKFSGGEKYIIPGDYSDLIPKENTFTISDLTGGIRDITIYAESDQDKLLEFLTDA